MKTYKTDIDLKLPVMNNFEERNKEILLISKAPELLEMLTACRDLLKLHYGHDVTGIDKLIKQATEL